MDEKRMIFGPVHTLRDVVLKILSKEHERRIDGFAKKINQAQPLSNSTFFRQS